MKLGRRCRRLPGARSHRPPLLFPSLLSSLSTERAQFPATSRRATSREQRDMEARARFPLSSARRSCLSRAGGISPLQRAQSPPFLHAIPGFPPYMRDFPSPARGFPPALARAQRPPRASRRHGDDLGCKATPYASPTPWFKKCPDDKASPRRRLKNYGTTTVAM